MAGYITIELVRDELQDRFPGDNSIDCDQFFSDEDIQHAMDRAAARYNQLPPQVEFVSGKALPANTSIFLDAVLANLYNTAIHKLARNLMTWQTGDVQVNLEKTRMEAFKMLKSELDQRWRRDAADRKAEINRSLAWGFY
jgi:hypothetical protein